MPRLGPIELLIANLRQDFPEGAIGYIPQEQAHRELVELAGQDFGMDPRKWQAWLHSRKKEAGRPTTREEAFNESKKRRPSKVVPVPETLREFMADVSDRVRAEEDSATTVSDDLLQCDRGYGGLREDGLFEFVFFPNAHDRWEFRLLADEIEEIGSGHRTELRVRINDDPPVDPWLLNNLDLAAGLAKLESIGVKGLSANSSRTDVVALLGTPGAEGGGDLLSDGHRVEPWIKYWLPQCQAHFAFFRSGKLRRITFMPRDWQPGM